MNHNWVATEGLAKTASKKSTGAEAHSGANADARQEQAEAGEITSEVKREASRRSLREIKKGQSQKSFKVRRAAPADQRAWCIGLRTRLWRPAPRTDK